MSRPHTNTHTNKKPNKDRDRDRDHLKNIGLPQKYKRSSDESFLLTKDSDKGIMQKEETRRSTTKSEKTSRHHQIFELL